MISPVCERRVSLTDRSTHYFMKIIPISILAGWLVMSVAVLADSPAPPRPWVVTSGSGSHLFKMVPAKWHEEGEKFVLDQEPFGVAYEIGDDGKFQEMWRTKGWYAFQGFLSDDGRYLAHYGPWASDSKKMTDVAVAFYDRGNLLKEHLVRDLIKEPDALERSVSHYMWRPAIQTEPNGFRNKIFHLVMVDKTAYDFDCLTGEIIGISRDEGAKSGGEIWNEEKAKAKKKGRELFEKSSFHDAYTESFEISNIEFLNGSVGGCSVEGDPWLADLKPKKELKHQAEISVVFPIVDDKRIEASITTHDIMLALEEAFDHPFISKRFETGGATGLRLRVQGDRLHWNTPELIELLTKIKGSPPNESGLRVWAYLIIDAGNPQFTSIYLNTQTKEILGVDSSKWPYEPFLLDATGSLVEATKVK